MPRPVDEPRVKDKEEKKAQQLKKKVQSGGAAKDKHHVAARAAEVKEKQRRKEQRQRYHPTPGTKTYSNRQSRTLDRQRRRNNHTKSWTKTHCMIPRRHAATWMKDSLFAHSPSHPYRVKASAVVATQYLVQDWVIRVIRRANEFRRILTDKQTLDTSTLALAIRQAVEDRGNMARICVPGYNGHELFDVVDCAQREVRTQSHVRERHYKDATAQRAPITDSDFLKEHGPTL